MQRQMGRHGGKREEVMAKVENVIICLGLAALLVVMMGASSAQPTPPEGPMDPDLALDRRWSDGRMMHEDGGPLMGVPVEMIAGGGGFALQNNETHLLRLSVVRLSPLEPGRIRDLLVSNKSVEEIREVIKAEEGQPLYRGSMRMDDISYPLTDIDVRPLEGNATIVDANIASPGSDPVNQTSIVGRLNMTVSISKGGRIGEGLIEMNSTEHKGSYQAMLDMTGHTVLFEDENSKFSHPFINRILA